MRDEVVADARDRAADLMELGQERLQMALADAARLLAEAVREAAQQVSDVVVSVGQPPAPVQADQTGGLGKDTTSERWKRRNPVRRGQKHCRRLKELIVFFGGALAGLLLFGEVARDSFAESTALLRCLFVGAVITAAVLLGFSRLNVEWFLVKCERGEVTDPDNDAPRTPFILYQLGTIAAGCAGLIVLIAAAWATLAPAHPQEVIVVPVPTPTPSVLQISQPPATPHRNGRH
jgi:hypothetical protein